MQRLFVLRTAGETAAVEGEIATSALGLLAMTLPWQVLVLRWYKHAHARVGEAAVTRLNM